MGWVWPIANNYENMCKMIRKITIVAFCMLLSVVLFPNHGAARPEKFISPKTDIELARLSLYDTLDLADLGLSKQAYIAALKGFASLQAAGALQNQGILSIIDFSLSSARKRLFVIDMASGRLLFNTFVAHGRNSGKAFATQFSNKMHSFRSSLGFYVTGDTYAGHHGCSLRLKGVEPGINDNAMSRGIVMHAANYVNEALAANAGCIGRSEGCPAIPVGEHRAIIENIKNGSCLFIYSPDKKYFSSSHYLQASPEA